MKAVETKFLEFLKKSQQFIIPIYQRAYSWTEHECRQLWNDIQRTGKDGNVAVHFIGSIVYIEKSQYQVSSQSPLLVIDGQQRLTTIMLILEALARRLGDQEPVDGFSAAKLREYYLINRLETEDRHFKLLLTQTDKETLLALMPEGPSQPPREASIRITENFKFFKSKIDRLDDDDLAAFCRGLAKLMIVDIALNRDQDNPQLIFESMNSTGRELSQADLIRNFILMGLETERQTRLYEEHWRPMEIAFGQQAYEQHFDGFMRHYLTVKTGQIPKVREVYKSFKEYAADSRNKGGDVDDLLAEVHAFAQYYCAMALDQETDRELANAFADLRELKADVVYPFLLEVYQDYKDELLSAAEFKEILRLTESYVFRRAVCAIPANLMSNTFAEFKRSLKKEQGRYMESVRAHFQLLPSYRRFPSDEEFRREIKVRDLYRFNRRSYWLRRLENYDRKERALVDEYTIEHILPQNKDLSPAWQNALGDDWRRVQEQWLHTLGNLTLTGYNPEYSDHPFAHKRDMKGGFKESPLRLNQGLQQLDTWDESEIKKRAERLAKKAAQTWPAPGLSDEVLQCYRPKSPAEESIYAIEDHKHLADGGDTRKLFELFRTEVLKLDPCINEKVLKNYIAYRAEINFVYLKAQKKQLRLVLSLPFYELHDPRKMAEDKDTSDRAKVRLQKPEDLPYVMGLVRQAFEKQMEDTKGDE